MIKRFPMTMDIKRLFKFQIDNLVEIYRTWRYRMKPRLQTIDINIVSHNRPFRDNRKYKSKNSVVHDSTLYIKLVTS